MSDHPQPSIDQMPPSVPSDNVPLMWAVAALISSTVAFLVGIYGAYYQANGARLGDASGLVVLYALLIGTPAVIFGVSESITALFLYTRSPNPPLTTWLAGIGLAMSTSMVFLFLFFTVRL